MTLSEEFLKNGIVKIKVEDTGTLSIINSYVGTNYCSADLTLENINEYRMNRIKEFNSFIDIKTKYFSLAKNALYELVGNELAMQRNINLSIQLPGDDSSLLPIHSDTLQGDSPYEVVLWVPLVDCYDTKSMFFAKKYPISTKGKTLDELYVECDPYFVDCKYGEALIFSQNWLHGNRINETNETRWSLNCRFKSLFSPYSDKKLGEFFEPIEIRPATRMGLDYETI